MEVSIHLKDGSVVSFQEDAVLEDRGSGRISLSCGVLSGGRIGSPNYLYKDSSHISYSNQDVDHIEIRPDAANRERRRNDSNDPD